MKTIADFKKRMVKGVNVHTMYHLAFAGRDEANKVIYKDEDKGVRTVTIVQSNSFALKTVRSTGEIVDSWCNWPKVKEVKFIGEDSVTLLEETREGAMIPVLTYTFVS